MTKLSVHTELLNKGPTDPNSGWLLPSVLIVGGVLAAVLIGATLGTPQSGSVGEAVAAQAFADSPRPSVVAAVDIMKLVPADALGKDLSWSPLTGDSSN